MGGAARRCGNRPACARSPCRDRRKRVSRVMQSAMGSCTQTRASAQCVRAQTHMRTRINKLHARISWAHQARLPNMRGVGGSAALSRGARGVRRGQVFLARRGLCTAKTSRSGAMGATGAASASGKTHQLSCETLERDAAVSQRKNDDL